MGMTPRQVDIYKNPKRYTIYTLKRLLNYFAGSSRHNQFKFISKIIKDRENAI